MNNSFSIIIPLYNKEKTIVNTLKSVSSLHGADYEVVVVDDGSTDQGPQRVREYPSDKIRLYQKTNGGVSSARNYGAQRAQNDWLIFLDADDLLFSDALETFNEMITKYPRDVVFASNFQQKRGDSIIVWNCKKEYVSEHTHRDIWLSMFYLRPGAFCCNRHAFFISGGYDERMSYNEDFEYCMRLSSIFRVVVSPKLIMEYVTESNEARYKTHPLEKNFSYYIQQLSIIDKYQRYEYYQRILASIHIYEVAGDVKSVIILKDIVKEKFSSHYSIIAKFLYRVGLLIKRFLI